MSRSARYPGTFACSLLAALGAPHPVRSMARATPRGTAHQQALRQSAELMRSGSRGPFEGPPRLLRVPGAIVAARALHPYGERAGGGQIERVQVDLWEAPAESDRLVGRGGGPGPGGLSGRPRQFAGANPGPGPRAA